MSEVHDWRLVVAMERRRRTQRKKAVTMAVEVIKGTRRKTTSLPARVERKSDDPAEIVLLLISALIPF